MKNSMKKQSGFTLIELVIVIIILGILAATAVPKFVDLQGDARAASMKGVKGALEGAATLTYSRAAIDGVEKNATDTVNGVTTVYGYPDGSATALREAAGLDVNDWDISGSNPTVITASSVNNPAANCLVNYTEATSSARPVIKVVDTGC